MKLLLGTTNKGKIIEIGEVLHDLNIKLLSPTDLGIEESPNENGDTFEANAILKAQFYFDRSGIPTLADDSGIVVEALQNELGIHTRRWGAGADASDYEWIEYFLKRMREEKNKRAAFVCSLAFIDANGKLHTFEGRCDGVITDELEADYLPGLPISACFKPDGHGDVYSAMSIEQKNSTSHRGRAMKLFRDYLESLLIDSQ